MVQKINFIGDNTRSILNKLIQETSSPTFGVHVTDPLERIMHRHNIRREIMHNLDHDQVAIFMMYVIGKKEREIKKKKFKGEFSKADKSILSKYKN